MIVNDLESNHESDGLINHSNQRPKQFKTFSDWLVHNYVRIAELAFVSASCIIVNWVLHNPLCNAMFRCGCSFSDGRDQYNVVVHIKRMGEM